VHPILIKIGPLQLPTYGFMMVIALVTAVYIVIRLGRREGLESNRLLDFSTWLIVVSLLGAKILMIVTDWRYFWDNPGEIFSKETLLAGGVFYGGFLAAVFFAVWYIKVYHLPLGKVFDVYSPAISLGLSIGRIGCFAGGCDYGKPTSSFLGVVFTNPYSHEISGVPLGVPLYPTQLFESLASFAIFLILLWKYRRKRYDGQIFVLYLALYAIFRFAIEFLRGDEDRGFVFGHLLSTSQFIALLMLALAAVLAIRLRTRVAPAAAMAADSNERRRGAHPRE
jgi:phosphatidylglycerol:prolipoprotein diacylglycerol transferase